MTRTEFRDRRRHELSGIMLDAAMSRATGAELSVLLRSLMFRLDALLGEMYDDLAPKPEPVKVEKNGHTGLPGGRPK